jgi:hypothetical protein
MVQNAIRALIESCRIQEQVHGSLGAPLPPAADAGEQTLADRLIGAAPR